MSSKGTIGLGAGRPSERNRAKLMASVSDTPVAMKRVNVNLTAEQHTRLKLYAIRQGKTITELLTAFVDGLPNE